MGRIALALLLAACHLPPSVQATREPWPRPPQVATDAPELEGLARRAAAVWDLPYVERCADAQICVRLGFQGEGPGRAEPGPHRCDAIVGVPDAVVAVHEVGHCLGLGHSIDPWSVMHAVQCFAADCIRAPRAVTQEDRRVAEELRGRRTSPRGSQIAPGHRNR